MPALVPGGQFCAITDCNRRFPRSRQLVRRRMRPQNEPPNRFNPPSSNQPPRPNPHSVRGTAPHPPPRFRALALFGRRSHQHVDSPVMPATKNLHSFVALHCATLQCAGGLSRSIITGGWCAVTAGAGRSQRSTSTKSECADGPCASFDVPLSKVSTLGLPCLSSVPRRPGSSGSYHAPVASWTTPGRIASVIWAPARHEPRSFRTRTRSP